MNANETDLTTWRGTTKHWGGRRLTAVVLIGVAGILLSFLLYGILCWQERRLIREEFNHRAADRTTSIAREFESGVALVRSVAAHIQTIPDVNRENFAAFTQHLFSPDATIHALSWNRRVTADTLHDHVLSARQWHLDYVPREMGPDGTIAEVDLQRRPPGRRDLVIVDLIEPLDANRAALGFDIASEPTRREALNRARDTGQLAATGGIRLVQESGTQFGMLVFAPIYQRDAEIVSLEQRQHHFQGVVVGVYRIGETVEAAIADWRPVGIDSYLFDETDSRPRLLHVQPSRLRRKSTAPIEDLETLQVREFCESSTIQIAGRHWTLCFAPTAEYIKSQSTWLPLIALGVGLLGTLLLVAYLSKLARWTDQLQHHLAHRKRAEQTLKKTQHSIDSSQIPVFWVGPDSRFRYVNAAAAESLGYEPGELCKMTVADIAPTWPVDEWAVRWAELKASGSAIFESVHQRKDGTSFPVEIMVNYFSYSEDEYMYCQALDITERNCQQERLREHERALAHVGRLSTLGEMIAGIAHEINQPLSAISNFAEACHKEVASAKYEFALPVEEWTQQIGKQAVRCGDIIRRLRGFVKRNETERGPVSVNEVVDDSIALTESDARNRSIRVSWQAAQPSPFVHADRVQLQQVMVNLLRNAYESVSENDSADRRVHVSSLVSRDAVEMIVEDDGHGINDEDIGRVFDAFFTTKPDGLGMGLAISRSIIEAHGGRLWAESVGSGGARFHVELPSGGEASHTI